MQTYTTHKNTRAHVRTHTHTHTHARTRTSTHTKIHSHAGVEDMGAAQATLAFVKKYELLDKKSLENLQLRNIEAGDAAGLPK